jgi:rhamnosyl/mannosyltransferase
MLRQSRADLFDFHFPYPWGELSGLLAGCRPLVVHYHSDIVRQKTLLRLYEPFLVKVLDRADKIIVESPQMRDNSKYLRCHKDKAVIIPAGIETKRFAQSPAVAERARQLRYRIAPGLGVVLFVGRFVYYKGLEHLLRAMKNVEAVLVLVGDGPLGPQLRGLSDSLGVSERVVFAGQVSDEELVAYYRMSDVLVLPSVETSETYGLVQLEAHASGIPVVSTALSTGVEFVNQQGVTGLVVPPRDAGALASAINALLTDDTLRIRMGTAARMRALRDFDIEVCARATLDVFRSMVA